MNENERAEAAEAREKNLREALERIATYPQKETHAEAVHLAAIARTALEAADRETTFLSLRSREVEVLRGNPVEEGGSDG